MLEYILKYDTQLHMHKHKYTIHKRSYKESTATNIQTILIHRIHH